MPEEMQARGKDVIRPNERYANTSVDAVVAAAGGLKERVDALKMRMDEAENKRK